MTDVAGLIAELIAAGTGAALVGRVAAALAQREVVAVQVRDEQGERRRARDREYRRRKRSVGRHPPTSADACRPAPVPPPETKVPPAPPSKTQPSPLTPRGPPVASADVEAIWAASPRRARERSSRADVGLALEAAARRGHDPGAIARALSRYYASGEASRDDHRAARGVHRMIEADRWADWTGEAAPVRLDRDPSLSPALWERVGQACGAGWAASYLSRARQAGTSVTPHTLVAWRALSERREVGEALAELGLDLVRPLPVGHHDRPDAAAAA